MVQAQAYELLNQKELGDGEAHPLLAASQRLVAALERLERGSQRKNIERTYDAKQSERLTFFERENESLRQERKKLDHAITDLQGRYDDLQRVATAIYGKLDDSIKRLSQIVET